MNFLTTLSLCSASGFSYFTSSSNSNTSNDQNLTSNTFPPQLVFQNSTNNKSSYEYSETSSISNSPRRLKSQKSLVNNSAYEYSETSSASHNPRRLKSQMSTNNSYVYEYSETHDTIQHPQTISYEQIINNVNGYDEVDERKFEVNKSNLIRGNSVNVSFNPIVKSRTLLILDGDNQNEIFVSKNQNESVNSSESYNQSSFTRSMSKRFD